MVQIAYKINNQLIMQNAFLLYLELGFDHILDFNAYDHLLFLVALCAVYAISAWRKVLILATAFTIGHSITLVLTALNIFHFPAKITEFLIPVTILLTAFHNVLSSDSDENESNNKTYFSYLIALFFGFIHGMGFSAYFKASQFPGQEEGLLNQLLAFNIGVELGQLIIIAFILGISFLAFRFLKIKQREWNLFVSGAAAGIAVILMIDNKFW